MFDLVAAGLGVAQLHVQGRIQGTHQHRTDGGGEQHFEERKAGTPAGRAHGYDFPFPLLLGVADLVPELGAAGVVAAGAA